MPEGPSKTRPYTIKRCQVRRVVVVDAEGAVHTRNDCQPSFECEICSLYKYVAAGLRRTLAPKVDGALNLAGAPLAHNPLSTLNIFSSMSGLLGTAGQANYTAANAAADCIAASLESQVGVGTATISCSMQQTSAFLVVLMRDVAGVLCRRA